MHVLVASIMHESSSFSEIETSLARFGVEPERGLVTAERVAGLTGADREIAGFVEILNAAGISFDMMEPAEALPSAPVARRVLEQLIAPVEAQLATRRYDGILLALHGAMVLEGSGAAEPEIIGRLKRLAPDIPIVASFDMHANLGPAVISQLDGVAGYRSYPHVDCAETGRRAARQLVAILLNRMRPVVALGRCAMMPQIMAQGTDRSPNCGLQALARTLENDGEASAVSLFTGFPHADVEEAGLSVVVVTDDNADAAERLVHLLLDKAWTQRALFRFDEEPLPASIARARAAVDNGDRAIVLLDHCDNTGSGGAMDTTTVLAAMVDAQLPASVFLGIYDPSAALRCAEAGVNTRITLDLGAKIVAKADYARSEPLRITGVVKTLYCGRFKRRGPFAANTTAELGLTVVFQVGELEIVILSKHTEPADLEYLYGLGIDPTRRRVIGLKSRVHWRAGFAALDPIVIACSGTGACISDFDKLHFNHIRRPIFPIDAVSEEPSKEIFVYAKA
jgi:microcystin degradation protein MlrC